MRFDTSPEGITLDARWSIFDGRSGDLMASKRIVITETIDAANLDRFEAIARAMAHGFGTLTAEIVGAMNAETGKSIFFQIPTSMHSRINVTKSRVFRK